MEGLTIFLSLTLLVFAVLQIILFFKVWGMTDNVKALREQIAPSYSSRTSVSVSQILKESYKGNPNLSNILFDAYYEGLQNCYSVIKPDGSEVPSSEFVEMLKNEYKPIYEKVGIPFPPVFESIKNREDFEKAFSL